MKVLITSPSLNERENVSGISTMVSSIIASNGCDYVHFAAGRKDDDASGIKWLTTQVKLPFAFRSALSRAKADVVHINTAFEPRAIIRDLVLTKSAGKRPVVLHVHGGRFVMQEFSNSFVASLARKLLQAAARVVVLSETEVERILEFAPEASVAVLPNAVSTSQFPNHERQLKQKTIVYLGRLDEAKGLSEMVEACRLLTAQGFRFTFACYGKGRDQEEFFRRMKNVIGDHFHYGGVVAGDEKIKALTSSDIFLMPSRFEGLPLALLESMAAGCVPVVSDRGSIPSVVEDGRNGFLIDPGDVTQIVGKLKYLLSEGERGWEEYRRNARETVRTRFDMTGYMERLKNIYAEAVSAK